MHIRPVRAVETRLCGVQSFRTSAFWISSGCGWALSTDLVCFSLSTMVLTYSASLWGGWVRKRNGDDYRYHAALFCSTCERCCSIHLHACVYVSIETTCMHGLPSGGHRSQLGSKNGDECVECWSVLKVNKVLGLLLAITWRANPSHSWPSLLSSPSHF